jgi:hypothetical protein
LEDIFRECAILNSALNEGKETISFCGQIGNGL